MRMCRSRGDQGSGPPFSLINSNFQGGSVVVVDVDYLFYVPPNICGGSVLVFVW